MECSLTRINDDGVFSMGSFFAWGGWDTRGHALACTEHGKDTTCNVFLIYFRQISRHKKQNGENKATEVPRWEMICVIFFYFSFHVQWLVITDMVVSCNCYIVIYTFMQHHNDSTTKTNACRKTQEWRTHERRHRKTSLQIYLPLTLLQGFEKGYSRFACDPTVMTVTLCLSYSSNAGVYSIGAFRGPPRSGVAFPTTSRL